MEPFATANALRFDSWSPDSRWIGYWSADGYEEPAFLTFANVETGQICLQTEVSAQDTQSGDLLWQEDGSVIALLGPQRTVFAGAPCKKFVEDNDFQVPDPRTWVEESPNRLYSAETHIFEIEGAAFHTNLKIIEIATNSELFSLTYIDSPHFFHFGPRWLNDEFYLIGQTVDQGILYYSISENRVGRILPDFLGLPVGDEENISKIGVHDGPDAGEYHLFFEIPSKGGSLLYHSELDQVEELPLYHFGPFDDGSGGWWGFSPDGEWLLLFKETPAGEYTTWYRLLDPAGSSAARFTIGRAYSESPSSGLVMAIIRQSHFYLVSFPDGLLVSRSRAPNFYLHSVWRSPDGARFAAFGIHNETGMQAIFIIKP